MTSKAIQNVSNNLKFREMNYVEDGDPEDRYNDGGPTDRPA